MKAYIKKQNKIIKNTQSKLKSLSYNYFLTFWKNKYEKIY